MECADHGGAGYDLVGYVFRHGMAQHGVGQLFDDRIGLVPVVILQPVVAFGHFTLSLFFEIRSGEIVLVLFVLLDRGGHAHGFPPVFFTGGDDDGVFAKRVANHLHGFFHGLCVEGL